MHTTPDNLVSWRRRVLGGIYLQNVAYIDIVGTKEDTSCAFSKLPKNVLKLLKWGQEINKNSVFGYSEEEKKRLLHFSSQLYPWDKLLLTFFFYINWESAVDSLPGPEP